MTKLVIQVRDSGGTYRARVLGPWPARLAVATCTMGAEAAARAALAKLLPAEFPARELALLVRTAGDHWLSCWAATLSEPAAVVDVGAGETPALPVKVNP